MARRSAIDLLTHAEVLGLFEFLFDYLKKKRKKKKAEWRNVGVLNENIISCWCCINLYIIFDYLSYNTII